jgi:hypothetical protein
VGLAFRSGKLFTFDYQADRLRQLDPATALQIGTEIDLGQLIQGDGDLAFRSDGVGFLADTFGSGGRLFRFGLGAPAVTIASGSPFPDLDGLAFAPSGTLYGFSQSTTGSARLYTINTTTGVATLIGDSGIPGNVQFAGLAFDATGSMFAAVSGSGSSPSTLYRVDACTGAATLVGDIGFDGVCGLAFDVAPSPVSFLGEGTTEGTAASFGGEGQFCPRSRRPALERRGDMVYNVRTSAEEENQGGWMPFVVAPALVVLGLLLFRRG